MDDRTASLYVHLPWCVRKCPYCDFNSHPLKAELPAQEYVDALVSDLLAQLEESGVRTIPAPNPNTDVTMALMNVITVIAASSK